MALMPLKPTPATTIDTAETTSHVARSSPTATAASKVFIHHPHERDANSRQKISFLNINRKITALAVAALAGWRLPSKRLEQISTHGALLSGCLVFVFPFAWLVGTSMKYDEEIFVYPPRWLPAWPQAIENSPYLSDEALTDTESLQKVPAERWQMLWPDLEPALGARTVRSRLSRW